MKCVAITKVTGGESVGREGTFKLVSNGAESESIRILNIYLYNPRRIKKI